MSILIPKSFKKTITAAGTAERLTDEDLDVKAVILQALSTNAGILYLGDEKVSSDDGHELAAGQNIVFQYDKVDERYLPAAELISLKDIWFDTSNSGDSVNVLYLVAE